MSNPIINGFSTWTHFKEASDNPLLSKKNIYGGVVIPPIDTFFITEDGLDFFSTEDGLDDFVTEDSI